MEQELLKPTCATNPIVFLDINIGPEFAGRLIIELRKDIVPKTAENFRALCTGERGIGTLGKPLHYKGNQFHKVTRVFAAHSGDVINNDGTSGESIYGPVFIDENFILSHEVGVISMVNYGKPNSNNSQFVITSQACENLNGTNVVVGKVLRGMGIISDMEQSTSDDGTPTQKIVICDCGEILDGQDWGINDNDETPDKLPPYPRDWDVKYSKLTSDEMVAVLTNIRKAGNIFFTQQSYYEARRKYRKAERYYQMLRSRFEWQEIDYFQHSDEDLRKLDEFAVVNYVNMATVELKVNEYANAKYACSEALRINPDYSKAYYRRGQAQVATKNFEDAISDFKRALVLLPNNRQILNELNHAKQLLLNYNRLQMQNLKPLFK